MTLATKPLSNYIAVVFDFDDTLVPDTVDSLLESLGIDALKFRQERIQPLVDNGWDKILARFYAIIEESKRQGNKITQEYLGKFGQQLAPFDGVPEMFEGQQQDGKTFVYRDVPPEELHVPLTQVIYVGDGASDIPCFSLLNEEQGTAVGVYKDSTPAEWNREIEISKSQRLVNLATAEYKQDSELMRSLTIAVESLCKQISLLQLSVGE